ncbi:T9SS type A sorting domain-containing protein [Hymenobacter cellulosilyticus]|uniref:T9SS type A sorting domain-containing protein n=1 Tax=Hymenobacter cellulosilyticus TaxID=2932248 RepID=A0A8T9Q928_9BACT|nr:T9SS type A sorting domain-containing protein [Hymenobacter cellulosilyticus]UOQ73635.1 T9SS type A sorting domain-containing protein [Hymenobacter cellulosilyticus]
MAGNFTQVNGQTRPGLARLTAPNVLAVGNKQLEARTEAWPVPAHSVLNLRLDADGQPRTVTLLDALGRAVLTQVVTQPSLALPTQHLRAGVYLLRVDYADGAAVRQVIVE